MRTYTPRRQSKRWLDGDCPKGVLAIYDNGGMRNRRSGSEDRYTVFYAQTDTDRRGDVWIDVLFMSEYGGFGGHDQMRAHEVAAYRYRWRHQACRWTDLPEAVRAVVRRDLAGTA